MKKIAIYSRSPVLSHGLRAILSDSFLVTGLFASFQELEAHLLTTMPDLILLEVTPEISFAALREIGTSCGKSKIILWIDATTPEFVSACLPLGVRGVLSKSASAETHIRCLNEVSTGGLWLDQELTNYLLGTRVVHLTPRERQLFGLLVQGLTNKAVAWAMGISPGTVKVYLSRLYPKVGVNDRFELALLGLRNIPSRSAPAVSIRAGDKSIPFDFPAIIRIGHRPAQQRSAEVEKMAVRMAGMAGLATPVIAKSYLISKAVGAC